MKIYSPKYLALTALLIMGCSKLTVTHLDNYIEGFKYKKIIISPFTGEWRVNQRDSTFHKMPEVKYYRDEIIKAVKKNRKGCLRLIKKEESLVSDFEYIMWKHRYAFRNLGKLDSLAFQMIRNKTNADLLLFIDTDF